MPGYIWFFVIVVAVPVIAGVASDMFRRHLKYKEKQLAILSSDTAEKAARYAAQTERLEQRVRVLERIVTDRGIVLADEIENLRDRPLN